MFGFFITPALLPRKHQGVAFLVTWILKSNLLSYCLCTFESILGTSESWGVDMFHPDSNLSITSVFKVGLGTFWTFMGVRYVRD